MDKWMREAWQRAEDRRKARVKLMSQIEKEIDWAAIDKGEKLAFDFWTVSAHKD